MGLRVSDALSGGKFEAHPSEKVRIVVHYPDDRLECNVSCVALAHMVIVSQRPQAELPVAASRPQSPPGREAIFAPTESRNSHSTHMHIEGQSLILQLILGIVLAHSSSLAPRLFTKSTINGINVIVCTFCQMKSRNSIVRFGTM